MKDKYAKGMNLEEFQKMHYSVDEIKESKYRAQYVCMLAQLRNKHKITQKQLEELSGIKQPMIARIENGDTMPRIDTFLKLLEPMGLTIKIVPIEEKHWDLVSVLFFK